VLAVDEVAVLEQDRVERLLGRGVGRLERGATRAASPGTTVVTSGSSSKQLLQFTLNPR
jgi:hypothetical protein